MSLSEGGVCATVLVVTGASVCGIVLHAAALIKDCGRQRTFLDNLKEENFKQILHATIFSQ